MTYKVGELLTPNTVGDMAEQNASAVLITGGVINDCTIQDPNLRLNSYSVSSAPANAPAARIIYVTDGDGGNPCLAVGNGSAWKRIALGATIST
jgi:hypothetical protein|tara:strand:+ start:351 stop:632 length:282 start_codon:yes stop_codon:yes gene_type:complete